DDTQLHTSTKAITPATHSTLTNCITEIKSWLQTNVVKLDCDKSEVIIIIPKSLIKSTHNVLLSMDSCTVLSFPHGGLLIGPTSHCSDHIKPIVPKSRCSEIIMMPCG
ncbi:hypothetical protein P3465_23365, partial [Vibrio parahaemolyticus]|nr:hypothetical protein [Vibrio parahaemolyticus]